MKKSEWVRETFSTLPSMDYLREKESQGWRAVAMEWEREVEAVSDTEPAKPGASAEEIPYGMQIANDCRHLEENPAEMKILRLLAEMIVCDFSFPRMADTLNQERFRTRDGHLWTPVNVFKLIPRLIDVAPKILTGEEWETRKKQLSRVTWNS